MRRVAFMNQKGGVGKTTTAVNLAASLARAGVSTLLVDLDPQAHATLHLGIDPETVESSVYDALLDTDAANDVVTKVRENLWLAPSEVDLAGVEIELADKPGRQGRLAACLAALEQPFDVMLVDCPPSLGLLTLNAMAAVESVVVPMQAHFLALQGFSKLLETIRLMSAQANPALDLLGVTLCMHDENTNLAKEVVADLESFFQQARASSVPWRHARVLRPAVRRNIKLAEAPSFGKTIFEYAPTSAGAADYHALGGAFRSALTATLLPPPRETPETPRVVVPGASAQQDSRPATAEAGA